MKRQNGSTRRRRYSFAVCSAMILATIVAGRISTPVAGQQNQDLKTFMRKKLDASSLILEGMATEDSALIKKGALAMLELSKAELWNRFTDEEYGEHDRDFRSTIRKLHRAATDENFDNVTLQWFDAVKGCVECHKHVRKERRDAK